MTVLYSLTGHTPFLVRKKIVFIHHFYRDISLTTDKTLIILVFNFILGLTFSFFNIHVLSHFSSMIFLVFLRSIYI